MENTNLEKELFEIEMKQEEYNEKVNTDKNVSEDLKNFKSITL